MNAPSQTAPVLTIGLVGVGAISDVYAACIQRCALLHLQSCAASTAARADAAAARFGCAATDLQAMLDDPHIDLVVNLTPAALHGQISRRILAAGKHLYTEKPLALTQAEALELQSTAMAHGVCIGSAPDTFFGAGHQAARAAVDAGAIGRPITGSGFVGVPGLEHFHPDPAGFYQPGGEPPYEIGPYYITQLVNLLGPVRTVGALAAYGPPVRTITSQPRAGQTFPVTIPTSFVALLRFADNVCITLTMSLDIWRHKRQPMELHGTEGSMLLPDPNFFSGKPQLSTRGADWTTIDIAERPFGTPTRTGHGGRPVADYRGVGLIDMAIALHTGGAHRCNAELATHVCDVAAAIVRAASANSTLAITTTCERPRPISAAVDTALVAASTAPDGPC